MTRQDAIIAAAAAASAASAAALSLIVTFGWTPLALAAAAVLRGAADPGAPTVDVWPEADAL
ncbi:MAG: hypothetical protein AAFU61_18520, partial [Pseudomonadota bacterium]